MKASFRNGAATVTLSHDLGGLLKRIVDGAQHGAGGRFLRDANSVASTAFFEWYQQVQERTGKSGKIIATLEVKQDSVIVKVGSTDTRVAKNGKPVVVYVRRPGALSTVPVEINTREYYGKKKGDAVEAASVFRAKKNGPGVQIGKFYKIGVSPLASDGAFLLQKLVKGPFRSMVKSSIKLTAKDIIRGKS